MSHPHHLLAVVVVAATFHACAAPARPRIFLTPESLAGLRGRSEDASRTSLGYVPSLAWEKLKQEADRFLAAGPYRYDVSIPGRNAGPATRWSYTLSEAPPPRHDESKHYPPWTAMFQERSDSITTRLKLLCFAFAVTQDRAYFERARDMVLKLCAWPCVWTDPSYSTGRPCLDTGHAATWVAIFYDWCYDALSEQERRAIHTALVDKALAPIDSMIDSVSPYHNFTAVIATGLCIGGIALLGEDDRSQGWIDHGVARAKLNFDAQGSDGGAMEGPMYGTYAARNLADMIWALSTAGIANELLTHPYAQTLPTYCVSLLNPNNFEQPCFGDGGPTRGFPNFMLILALQGDQDAAWYCKMVKATDPTTVRRLIALDPTKVKPRQPTLNPSQAFVDVGYAILRDGYKANTPFLALKCGPPSRVIGHNHLDHNSFVINYAGAWVAWDPGYRSYFDPRERKYTVSTFGHNSVVLDLDQEYLDSTSYGIAGHDQLRLDGGRISEFFRSPGFDYVLGQGAAPYNPKDEAVLHRFERQIVFAKPHLFFVRDTLAAGKPHRYSFLLHARKDDFISIDSGHMLTDSASARLDTYVFSPHGAELATAVYPGAERRGPYASATTRATTTTTFTSVLVPRRQTQLIVNGGFESEMVGWRPRRLKGWTENHVVDREVFHSGAASARLDGPGGYYYTRQFALPPGTKITARWWAKCTADK